MTSHQSQNIQQLRAHYALTIIHEVPSEEASRFKAYATTLPAMIQMNGLGQALAFAKQKSNGKGAEAKAWKRLYSTLSSWLTQERNCWTHIADHEDVLPTLLAGTQEQYQIAQAEAQALLCWVKDFARAELKNEETQ